VELFDIGITTIFNTLIQALIDEQINDQALAFFLTVGNNFASTLIYFTSSALTNTIVHKVADKALNNNLYFPEIVPAAYLDLGKTFNFTMALLVTMSYYPVFTDFCKRSVETIFEALGETNPSEMITILESLSALTLRLVLTLALTKGAELVGHFVQSGTNALLRKCLNLNKDESLYTVMRNCFFAAKSDETTPVVEWPGNSNQLSKNINN
jgi:hypothetical protein